MATTEMTMRKLDQITDALKSGKPIVDIIRGGVNTTVDGETECPCGTADWEAYVADIIADALGQKQAV